MMSYLSLSPLFVVSRTLETLSEYSTTYPVEVHLIYLMQPHVFKLWYRGMASVCTVRVETTCV